MIGNVYVTQKNNNKHKTLRCFIKTRIFIKTDDDRTMDDVHGDNKERRDHRGRDRKNKKKLFATKVVVRRLPPTMTEETFLKQIEPLPPHDYYYFVSADWSLGQFASSRAYINFVDQADVFLFKDKFDGYVFVDTKGVEYPAIVEFAPFQSLPKTKSRKFDNKTGTIEEDASYQSFLAALGNEDADGGKPEMKMEYSYQIKDVKMITTTPLLEFLANKQDERREERRRKNEDRKKNRDEEKSRKKDVVPDNVDKKRRGDGGGGGKSRNRLNLHKSMASSIPEEEAAADDGIVVRTVKSRIMDRNNAADRRSDRRADENHRAKKAQQAQQAHDDGGGGGGGNNNSNKDDKDAINRGRAEAVDTPNRPEGARDSNRRKDRRNRNRGERDAAKRTDDANERHHGGGGDLKATSRPPFSAASTAPIEESANEIAKMLPPREEKVKKYSESRRERRAARSEARHAQGDTAPRVADKREADMAPMKVLSGRVKIASNPQENAAGGVRRASGDSSSGGERGRDHSNAKLDRIRNKDRPTLQLYQPGRRRATDSDKGDDAVTPITPNDADKSAPDFSRPKPADSNNAIDSSAVAPSAAKQTEKRVSRYSERRNKQREQQRKARNDADVGGATFVEDMQKFSLKEVP